MRTNPVDPSNPLQKLTHTVTIIVSCIQQFIGRLDVCLILFRLRGLYGFRAQYKAERLGPVDPGISREPPTCILREGTHLVLRAM